MKYTENAFQLVATDLYGHLACPHLTQLNRRVTLGEFRSPYRNDPSLEILIKRGREHEQAFVEYLEHKGLSVINLQNQPTASTVAAMAKGIDVIVQAPLEDGRWSGIADVLLKRPGESRFGAWEYEVYDTKLSLNTRAGTILQLCLYTDLLSAMQGSIPEKMYVVKPIEGFLPDEYRYAEFQAYYRFVKGNLTRIMDGPLLDTYPKPVAHCDICNWWPVCDKKRHDDDYLSLVAGIRTLHIEELQRQDIHTLESFARATLAAPERGDKEILKRKQQQAKVQLSGRERSALEYKLLPLEKDRGFNRLPVPNPGDVYFDIEGDAFYPDGGLEYLFGYAFREKDNTATYQHHWATNRLEEKNAFEAFMGFLLQRLKAHPNLHIFHFAPYEASAVKRLASTHARYEREVDELLRADRFVDLHAIFKEALLASVEQYSLKALEQFTRYTRKLDLPDARMARKNVEAALELQEFRSLAAETVTHLEVYNEDDCMATEALHDWLEKRRETLVQEGMEIQRPVPKPQEPNENLRVQEARSRALYDALVKNIPAEGRSDVQQAQWLLAHQIEYFRREDKTVWWEHFRLQKMEHEDLLDERKAITGLVFVEAIPPKGKERLPTHKYTFPFQEIGLQPGEKLMEVNSISDTDKVGREIGTIESVVLEENAVCIKKKGATVDIHPVAVHIYDRVDPDALWTSLMELANSIIDDGLDPPRSPYRAAKDLLMSRRPRLRGGQAGAELLPEETVDQAAIRIALSLDGSILPIQGPPGTGKTHTGAKMILELIKEKKRVGVTAVSHRVIITLLEKVHELSVAEGVEVSLAHKGSRKTEYMPDWIDELDNAEKVLKSIGAGAVVGGTAWLWSDNKCIEALDYLFIDEAGQMSLSQALAASRAARNLILLGDPQQLEQPQRGAHPEGSDVAALTHLLEGKPTMPPGKGLFLGVTRRIHPGIAGFTSELFYDGKLTALPGLEAQVVSGTAAFDGAGLFYVPIEHTGNQNSSPEEVYAVERITKRLLKGGQWTDRHGTAKALTKDDILIVAPYNAQVATLTERLPGFQVGTVDKFQGKEAPVVIYSMASSSVQDAPRGMGFLFSPNRLNVATSRAKSVCILVSSPRLLEPECNTIQQMSWANNFCRFKELATTIADI
ncbi:TM0106 family RecB-like putative nuclease [Dawidia soli]|uniref:TM0106 family RecB-like putative nuclease n=1 Tax=Dawidia soli TaxID=2782352 RepID=A0AAP2GIN1_9BACT|nr:TM0106 family RecB-like putative nuclease [Dawidia soli]MBT1688491.1 TM0106 family RecB-like putative nuclease [Dawidia soli]